MPDKGSSMRSGSASRALSRATSAAGTGARRRLEQPGTEHAGAEAERKRQGGRRG